MKILFLDTSSKYLSLAVAEDDRVLSQMHRLLDRKHSTQLVSLIDKVLKKARLSLKRIDGFCVSKGPGSFTGLRIGITTVKGLAFVLQKPVVAIPSLDILAQNACAVINRRILQVCPIIDAKQDKVYTSLYQTRPVQKRFSNGARNGKVMRKSGYLLLTIEELLKKLVGEILFLGDAILLYRENIRKSKKIKPIFAKERFWYPQATRAVPLAMKRFREGKLDDVNGLRPLYLYPKECQIKKVIGHRFLLPPTTYVLRPNGVK